MPRPSADSKSGQKPAGGRRRAPRRRSLIDWQKPGRNARVLDWRERARHFGLVHTEEETEAEEPEVVDLEPARLLEEEEPEAITGQLVPEEVDIAEADEELSPADVADAEAEAARAGLSNEDLDLVRVYLTHASATKLLTAEQEREIGLQIEEARAELVGALALIPCAVATISRLAESVRRGEAPCAELILLPDGGEMTPEKKQPVVKAFNRITRLERSLADWRADGGEARPGAPHEEEIRRAEAQLAEALKGLPLRPSLVDEIVTELEGVNRELQAAESAPPGTERDERIRE
ncbi:MAG TPA: sigma-70 factor domain-containing protein, partial [Vicinamibacterales bacterium]